MTLIPDPQATTGFLLIDKAPDWTSHDVVAKLRGITKTKTVGHAGTLDPFATGLLIVGVGRAATKELARFLKADKIYEATARFDGATDTDDVTGRGVLQYAPTDAPPSNTTIESAFATQVGTIQQMPPAYSAKKIGGKKMYELARAGTVVEQQPVSITIFSLTITRLAWPDVDFTVHCSSGTYIRAIARDVGAVLGTGGYLTHLRRTAIGPITSADCVTLDSLTKENWQTFLWKLA